jgi:hypothetical protein
MPLLFSYGTLREEPVWVYAEATAEAQAALYARAVKP